MTIDNDSLGSVGQERLYPGDDLVVQVEAIEFAKEAMMWHFVEGLRKIEYCYVCLGASVENGSQVVGCYDQLRLARTTSSEPMLSVH